MRTTTNKETMTKPCAMCKIEKPVSEFVLRKGREHKPGSYCKPCHAARGRKWNGENPEVGRAYRRATADKQQARSLMRNYGITKQEYDDRLACQNGVCAICGDQNPRNRLSVDHFEVDSEIVVRGLLCEKCNFGIGLFRENPRYLQNAIKYLEIGQVQ